MQKDPYSRVAPRTADLVLGVGGEIDLVSLNEASIVLAREVADSGDCLYASDADAEVEFVTRARSRYWDFKPFWTSSGGSPASGGRSGCVVLRPEALRECLLKLEEIISRSQEAGDWSGGDRCCHFSVI